MTPDITNNFPRIPLVYRNNFQIFDAIKEMFPVLDDDIFFLSEEARRSRLQCSEAFLENGLLPALNHNSDISDKSIFEITARFLDNYYQQHPHEDNLPDQFDFLKFRMLISFFKNRPYFFQ